jgi:hypothetical protein
MKKGNPNLTFFEVYEYKSDKSSEALSKRFPYFFNPHNERTVDNFDLLPILYKKVLDVFSMQ